MAIPTIGSSMLFSADRTTLVLAAAAYLVAVSAMIAVIDSRRLIIPNALNAASAGGALAFAVLLDPASALSSITGGLVGFFSFLLFKRFYRSIRGHEGLGFGDVKYMAGAGLWVGWQGLAPMMFVSSLAALFFVAARGVLAGGIDPRRNLPFGPFLCLGTLTVWSVQAAGLAPWASLQ